MSKQQTNTRPEYEVTRRWQYRALKLPPHLDWYASFLNAADADGWELVTVDGGVAFFRRDARDQVPA
jgi:hypothetical protein